MTPTWLTFGIQQKKISFVLSAERCILTQEQVASVLVATRSCVKIRLSALDTNEIYCSLYSKIWPSRCRFACGKLVFPYQCGKILSWFEFSTYLKFYRTSGGKSTFRTQNDTKANFRSMVDKIVYCVSSAERLYTKIQPSWCRLACGKLIFPYQCVKILSLLNFPHT